MQETQKREMGLRGVKQYCQSIKRYFQNHVYKHAEYRDKRGWRLLIDYLCLLPIVGLIILLTFGLQHTTNRFLLADGVLVLAIALTALWWGWGPALFLTFLGMVALDYLIITPNGELSLIAWPGVLQLLPFCLAGITIGILSRLRDKGWLTAGQHAHELAVANRKLEEESQLKDRFLSMTSHELKTPITSIRMQSQLLQRRLKKQSTPQENDVVLQALAKIDERTRTLTGMIDELLDFSRTQQQQTNWQRQQLDVNTLCEEVVEDQKLITGRSVLLSTAAIPASVWGDVHRLSQVVGNLVANAAKYSPDSTPIEITVERTVQHVVIQVRDYGQGIESEQLEHIFEPFYRTPETQNSTIGGLGLGLAITRQIVNFHDGRIWCVSAKGQGSTFSVELPFSSGSQTSPSKSQAVPQGDCL